MTFANSAVRCRLSVVTMVTKPNRTQSNEHIATSRTAPVEDVCLRSARYTFGGKSWRQDARRRVAGIRLLGDGGCQSQPSRTDAVTSVVWPSPVQAITFGSERKSNWPEGEDDFLHAG
jgi:hypothetical protein